MTRRYPHGVPCWIDRATTEAGPFYAELLCWRIDDGVAHKQDRPVAGIGDPLAGPAWTTYVGVDDLDRALRAVDDHGGRTLERHANRARIADPQGAELVLAQDHHEAEAVNGDGTWNWSSLATPDPYAAEAFYAAVLGWRYADPGFGAAMVQVPGYGDLLATRDPQLRERHAQDHVPDGFSDAVAWLGHGDEPAWTVTFSVADTDATVERARALGATITSEPQTLGPTRVAELTDPHGAPLTVSTYAG